MNMSQDIVPRVYVRLLLIFFLFTGKKQIYYVNNTCSKLINNKSPRSLEEMKLITLETKRKNTIVTKY